MKKPLFYISLFLLLFVTSGLKAQHVEVLQQGKPTSIRGLSVVDDNTAWISGSKGTIAITNDGGKTWDWKQVKGFEKSDFRDIEAFSSKVAIIMSSGTPALILKTTDGGENWQVKYKNTDTTYFFDAMDFAGEKHGFVLGDPIAGKFVLMETNDGGETWSPFKNPPDALKGEAAFAASGTCLRLDSDQIYIVTGGSRSRLLIWLNDKIAPSDWAVLKLAITQGKPSQGAFSLANGTGTIVVGGDYQKDLQHYQIVRLLVFNPASSLFPIQLFFQPALREATSQKTAAKHGVKLTMPVITFAAKQSMVSWFSWLAIMAV